MPLDLRYSNSAHYTVETRLLTNVNWILTGLFALIVMELTDIAGVYRTNLALPTLSDMA
jgi:hypothetical protein